MKKPYIVALLFILLVVGYIIGAKDNKPEKVLDTSELPSRFD